MFPLEKPPVKTLLLMAVASALALWFLLFGSSSETVYVRAIGVFAASGWLIVSLVLLLSIAFLRRKLNGKTS